MPTLDVLLDRWCARVAAATAADHARALPRRFGDAWVAAGGATTRAIAWARAHPEPVERALRLGELAAVLHRTDDRNTKRLVAEALAVPGLAVRDLVRVVRRLGAAVQHAAVPLRVHLARLPDSEERRILYAVVLGRAVASAAELPMSIWELAAFARRQEASADWDAADAELAAELSAWTGLGPEERAALRAVAIAWTTERIRAHAPEVDHYVTDWCEDLIDAFAAASHDEPPALVSILEAILSLEPSPFTEHARLYLAETLARRGDAELVERALLPAPPEVGAGAAVQLVHASVKWLGPAWRDATTAAAIEAAFEDGRLLPDERGALVLLGAQLAHADDPAAVRRELEALGAAVLAAVIAGDPPAANDAVAAARSALPIPAPAVDPRDRVTSEQLERARGVWQAATEPIERWRKRRRARVVLLAAADLAPTAPERARALVDEVLGRIADRAELERLHGVPEALAVARAAHGDVGEAVTILATSTDAESLAFVARAAAGTAEPVLPLIERALEHASTRREVLSLVPALLAVAPLPDAAATVIASAIGHR